MIVLWRQNNCLLAEVKGHEAAQRQPAGLTDGRDEASRQGHACLTGSALETFHGMGSTRAARCPPPALVAPVLAVQKVKIELVTPWPVLETCHIYKVFERERQIALNDQEGLFRLFFSCFPSSSPALPSAAFALSPTGL